MASALLSISATICFAAQPSSPNAPHVVVITIDGFPARALQDPRLPMPTLRALAASGAVASGMQPINPTVTWPNHTAILTGVNASQHHVIANGLIILPADGSAPEIEPWTDKDKLVHAETLYEAADRKGLTTGQVDWVAIYGANGVRWQFGEKPDVNGEIPQELIADHIATREQIEQFGEKSTPAWRDEIWTDAAVDIIEKHQPNLTLVHLLETDSLQHQYGPLTPAAYAAYAYADQCVARVVDAVRSAGIRDQTTFFILSDHGFATYTHTISPNVALVQQGLLHLEGGKYKGSVWVKAEGGAASLYILDPKLRVKLVPKLKAYFSNVPGIAHVYTNREALALGLPDESDTEQAPQLYLAAAADFAFGDDTTGDLVRTNPPRGQHGYLNSLSDMQALFIASGAAIRPGVTLGSIPNLQVAPTIAKILGIQLPAAKQAPLNQILRVDPDGQ
ncbi:alkaline phosphatase family protein [Granulicella aggregans]|uniref:alkaline phosphatase family protein n=1 Tax=Granulicella aggregans TaxID=474949 RepID=UPI0021E08E4E|nr:alkaline phosphatase family protein [Granulicella aggregans]